MSTSIESEVFLNLHTERKAKICRNILYLSSITCHSFYLSSHFNVFGFYELLLDPSFSSCPSANKYFHSVDQTITFMSTGKGSGELCPGHLLCCDCLQALTLQRGRRRGDVEDPTAKSPWVLASDEVLRWNALHFPDLLHFIFSPPDKWVVFCHDHFAVLFRPLVAFSLLMAEESLSAPDSNCSWLLIRSYCWDQGNRLGESVYWPCCWNAKCAMECAECHY